MGEYEDVKLALRSAISDKSKADVILRRLYADTVQIGPSRVEVDHVATYADDVARDAGIPSPTKGMVVWNEERNCIQTYSSDYGVWVGWDPNTLPTFVNLLPTHHHLIPGFQSSVEYGGNVFSLLTKCYSDGEKLYDADGVATPGQCWAANESDAGIFVNNGSYLYKSSDGTSAYAKVLTNVFLGLTSGVVDCGSDRIIAIQYSETNRKIYGSVDGGDNFGDNGATYDDDDPLIEAHADAIRHFHGGAYDSTNDVLYIFTGDSDAESSILICDDIDDLFANPDTWKTRWGLDGDRTTTGNEPDSDYVVGWNSQRYRVISMAFQGDYGYTAADAYVDVTGTGLGGYRFYRIHRTSYAVEDIYVWPVADKPSDNTTAGLAAGTGWLVGLAEDGETVLISTASENTVSGYRNSNDEYVRLYAVLADGRQAVEIARVRRLDTSDPSAIANWERLNTLGNATMLVGDKKTPPLFGRVLPRNRIQEAFDYDRTVVTYNPDNHTDGMRAIPGIYAAPVPLNWCDNGRFINDTTGWAASANANIARNTGTRYHAEVASLAITRTGDNAYAKYEMTGDLVQALRGQLVTVSAFFYLPSTRHANQNPGIALYDAGGSAQVLYTPSLPDAMFDGDWHELFVSLFIATDSTQCDIRLYGNRGTDDETMDVIYVSDVRLGPGILILPPKTPAIVNVV